MLKDNDAHLCLVNYLYNFLIVYVLMHADFNDNNNAYVIMHASGLISITFNFLVKLLI